MTEEQKLHVTKITDIISDLTYKKYAAGAKEHNGNVWDMSEKDLDWEELMEVLDLAVYKLTRMIKKGYL